MDGIYSVIAEFMASAALVGITFGILTRGINIFIRAISGKEDIL